MEKHTALYVLAALLLCLSSSLPRSTPLPLCLNSESPSPPKIPLSFCSSLGYNKSSCCDSQLDKNLEATFQSFNVSTSQCADFLKQILCAQCDPYAADLFGVQLGEKQSIPLLCNSSLTSNSTAKSYCSNVWNACKDVTIQNSPFAPSLQGGTHTTPAAQPPSVSQVDSNLTSLWQSEDDFCTSLGASSGPGQFCYSGTSFAPFSASQRPDPNGICFEKIYSEAYLNMIPHPGRSNRVFLASQIGKIWLATLPEVGSGKLLSLNESFPFLDISERVSSAGEYGLLGLAFHPDFRHNGRFFVSYNCDRSLWPDCAGQCSCNSDVGCKLSDLGSDPGTTPCQYSSVIAEYSANSSSVSPLEAVSAQSDEVRRIFTMGLPYSTHHAGQILFGPTDEKLYFMMGDGGSSGDPFNFAQNKKSLLGKIMRLDIDIIPDPEVVSKLGLWGNYSIPSDNPFAKDNSSRPEIWAYGVRNPWRCSFDVLNPTYFYCADVGQDKLEEVDLITKGGNYGWRVYEGTSLYTPLRSPGGNTSASSIQPIFPILEYDHKSVHSPEGAASITGGFVSRSTQDACLYGRYIYTDLYGTAMWAAVESPPGSGNYTTTQVRYNCSGKSPSPCDYGANRPEPSFLYAYSFGEDNRNNLYLLTYNGVFRVVDPTSCNYLCNETLPTSALSPNVSPSPATGPSVVGGSTPSPSIATKQASGAKDLRPLGFISVILYSAPFFLLQFGLKFEVLTIS